MVWKIWEKRKKQWLLLRFGCKTNQYESNAMAQKFQEAGYEICKIEESPDIIIVNTCTVTNIADRKSRQMLRSSKDKNKNAVIVAVRLLCTSRKRKSR